MGLRGGRGRKRRRKRWERGRTRKRFFAFARCRSLSHLKNNKTKKLTGRGRDRLRHSPLREDVGRLLVLEKHALGRVVQAKVGPAVDDDALHGDAKALVEGHGSAALGDFREAVDKARELAGLGVSDVGGQARTSKVQGVDDQQGTGAGETTAGHVGREEAPEVGVRVVAREQVLDRVLEGEVEGLRREIPDDVSEVAAPEGGDALLGGDAGEAVEVFFRREKGERGGRK